MDKRTLLAVMISISIYYAWMVLKGPPPNLEEVPAPVDGIEEPAPNAAPKTDAAPGPVSKPAPESDIAVETLDLEICGASFDWTNDGGAIHNLRLNYQTAPYDLTPFWAYAMGVATGEGLSWNPYGPEPGPETILSDDALALAAGAGAWPYDLLRMQVLEKSADRVVASGLTADGIQIRYELKTLASDDPAIPCQGQLDVTWTNIGGPYAGPVWITSHDVVPTVSGMFAMYKSNKQVTAYVDGDVLYGKYDPEEGNSAAEPEVGETTWMAIGDRYFAAVAIPDDPTGELAFSGRQVQDDLELQGMTYTVATGLAAGETVEKSFRLYFGSNDTEVLGAVHPDMPQAVDLGYFAFFGYPLLFVLKLFHSWVGNWGLAIILLTLTMKMLLFPLTQTAFKSSQAMQSIQPKMQVINEKFAENPEEKQKAIMALFKENNVNPLGGCLPMVIQMPVWFALYRVLLSSVELYHTEFLYLHDLSSPDPYGVLPAIVVVLMLVQQQFTPMGNMDPAQARMMKLMPLAFGVFFFTFPSGLVVYIFMNMLLSILQQWFIRRTFKAPEGPASAAPAPAA